MSIDAISWAWGTDATHASRLVLLALADSQNEKTGLCCPSIARLVEMTRLARTSIMEAIRQLEESGLVTVSRKNGCGSRYVLNRPNQSENRTGSEIGPVQKSDRTSPKFGPDRSRIRTRNQKEPETTRASRELLEALG